MDPFTHALSGALLARATAGRGDAAQRADVPQPATQYKNLSLRARVVIGFFAAMFPDIDIVLTWASPATYLTQHRGLTHSWLMLPLWALLLAWLLSRVLRDARGLRPYFGVCALGIGIHIIGDWITSFGTMMLAPFSDQRFALGSTFIIDLILTGIILAALLGCLLWRGSRVPGLLGLLAVSGYVAFQWTQQQKALAFGEQYAQSRKLSGYRVAALPRPVSPFNWSVYVSTPERYHVAHINLVRSQTPSSAASDGFLRRLSAGYRALHDAQWQVLDQFGAAAQRDFARAAWQQPDFAFYRWFAAFPLLDRVEQSNPETCVWFRDARFDIPARSMFLFHYGLCREDGAQTWRVFKLNVDGSRTAI
jgi:inner membrane protein